LAELIDCGTSCDDVTGDVSFLSTGSRLYTATATIFTVLTWTMDQELKNAAA